MNVTKEDVPAEIDSPVAVARHQRDFGGVSDYETLAGEYFPLTKGADITGLLEGLEDDLCQSPHWGYVLRGEWTSTDADDSEAVDEGGDRIYWPRGHTIRAGEDTDFVLFSPQREHGEVVEHIRTKVEEGA